MSTATSTSHTCLWVPETQPHAYPTAAPHAGPSGSWQRGKCQVGWCSHGCNLDKLLEQVGTLAQGFTEQDLSSYPVLYLAAALQHQLQVGCLPPSPLPMEDVVHKLQLCTQGTETWSAPTALGHLPPLPQPSPHCQRPALPPVPPHPLMEHVRWGRIPRSFHQPSWLPWTGPFQLEARRHLPPSWI